MEGRTEDARDPQGCEQAQAGCEAEDGAEAEAEARDSSRRGWKLCRAEARSLTLTR